MNLSAQDIHLWLAPVDEIRSQDLELKYRRILSDQERLQEKRFHFQRDRSRYLVTRVLVRTVLSRYASIAPECWRFSADGFGRPLIDNDSILFRRLSFNVSHTHSLVVLGVTTMRTLGVDVENTVGREVSIEAAGRYFAPEEVKALAAINPRDRLKRFLEYWTFKESYIKARGMGLSIPLDKVGFSFPEDGRVRIDLNPELGDDALRWELWQFSLASTYLVAICAEAIDGPSTRLQFRKTIPLVAEEVIAPRLLRTSN